MMRVLSIFSITSLLVAGWVGLSALVMVWTDAAPGALVVMPSQALMSDLPDGAAVTGAGRFSITIDSASGRTRDLYAAGAWLVLPAGLTGCLPMPKTQAKPA